jgi:CPA2 family monovalent cation:H+ antiporter-2
MIVAGVVTLIFHRFKQPVVLGYILAGVVIGPYTPPFQLINDQEIIKTLGDLGLIFLMFSLGLEFSLRQLKRVGVTALIAASLQIVLMMGVGYQIGRFFGWSIMDSLFMGAMLSISSTTIIIKALGELGKSKERFADFVFGILIVQDILAISLIALLSGVAKTGSLQPADILLTLGKLGIFLIAALVVGLLTVPRLLAYIATFKSNELFLVVVLGLCFGACLLVVKFGYSIALGALLIGAIMAEARQIVTVERLTGPIRDMFSAVFFVSIGLLIDPKILVDYAAPILVITLAVVCGMVFTCTFGTFVAGHDIRTSLKVGMSLAQIGEFSFIIASLGLSLSATSKFLYPIAVAVSAITTFLTPYLIKSSDGLVNWFDRIAPKPLVGYLEVYTRWVGELAEKRAESTAHKLIRRWSWQMGLNLALIIALFATAAIVAQSSPRWLPEWIDREHMAKPMLWLAAALASLPLFIALYRKLQALGMVIADISVSPAVAGSRTYSIRYIIAQTIPLAGIIGCAVLVLALSSAILPPLNVLAVLGLVVLLVTFLLWRAFIRLYSKAQIALTETFAQMPPIHEHSTSPNTPIHDLLTAAQLRTISIAADSFAAKKLISELRLRTLTGASIVAIQRGVANIINPGAEEEILPGDKLLLLGTELQLKAADSHLVQPSPGSENLPSEG